jgi:hypothetical protein
MRAIAFLLGLSVLVGQPMMAMAAEQVTTVEKSQVDTANGYNNPFTEVVIFPVRLVTGVIGAPIGAVGGLFTGFVKGFNWPGGTSTTQKTQRSTTTTAE